MIPHVRKGQKIEADHINALIDAINALTLTAAAPLQITRSPGGGSVISLGFGFDELCVCELTADLSAGGNATANIVYDRARAGTWAETADTAEITVYAVTDMSGTTGDRVIAKFDRQSGLWIALQKDC